MVICLHLFKQFLGTLIVFTEHVKIFYSYENENFRSFECIVQRSHKSSSSSLDGWKSAFRIGPVLVTQKQVQGWDSSWDCVPFSLASLRLFSSRSSLLRRVLCCCSAWSYTSVGSRAGYGGKPLMGDPALLVPLSSPKGAGRGKESRCLFRILWLDFSCSVRKALDSWRLGVLGGRPLSGHSGLVSPGGGRLGGKGES